MSRGRTYTDFTGRNIPMPTWYSPREELFHYVKSCMEAKHPGITDDIIEEVWTDFDRRTEIVLEALTTIMKQHQANRVWYKVKGYRNAIGAIKRMNVPLVSGSSALRLPGVGAKTAEKIDEILETERLRVLEERDSEEMDRDRTIALLSKVWGISAITAGELWKKGCRSINGLSRWLPSRAENSCTLTLAS